MHSKRDDQATSKREKPWWWPKRTDAEWCQWARGEYGLAETATDGSIRYFYADNRSFAVAWDHLGDARDEHEELAKAFLIAIEALEQNVSAFMALAGFGPEIKALIGEDSWNKIGKAVQDSRAALSKATGEQS